MHIDTHGYTYTVYIYQKLNFLSFPTFFLVCLLLSGSVKAGVLARGLQTHKHLSVDPAMKNQRGKLCD